MANYLYNGVELPALPEWDKETYPYALLKAYGEIIELIVSTVPYTSNGTYTFTAGEAVSYEHSNGEWTEYKTYSAERVSASFSYVWTNTNIYSYNGETLYHAASEPIPTPENIRINLTGWRVKV